MIAVGAGVGGTPPRVRVRRLLAALQIALAVLLLSAGGLLTRTIVRLLRADIGVEPRGVIVSQWMLTSAMNFEAAGRQRWMENVLQRVRALPGAIAAGAGSSLPPDNAGIVVTARLVTGTTVTETPELSLAPVTPTMYCQARVSQSGGRLLMHWLLIGTMLLTGACGRGGSVDRDQRRVLGQDAKFDVTEIRAEDSELNVFYLLLSFFEKGCCPQRVWPVRVR